MLLPSCSRICLLIIITFSCLGLFAQEDYEVVEKIKLHLSEKYEKEFGSRLSPQQYDAIASNLQKKFNTDIKVTENLAEELVEAEPTIAVNPTNPDNIVISFVSLRRDMISPQDAPAVSTYYSEDGGLTWNQSDFRQDSIFLMDHDLETGSILAGAVDPVLTFGKDGKLYCVWIYGAFGPDLTIGRIASYWGWSDDGGKTLQVAEEREDRLLGTATLNNFEGTFVDRPWIAVDNSDGPLQGTVYIQGLVFSQGNHIFPESFFGLSLITKRPDSNRFTSNQNLFRDLTTESNSLQHSNISVDENGVLHSSFTSEVTLEEIARLYHMTSDDGGESFENTNSIDIIDFEFDQHTVYRDNPLPDAVTSPVSGTIHYVNGTLNNGVNGEYRRSFDNGSTWEFGQDINTMLSESFEEILFPTIALDNVSGRISIAFMARDSIWNYYITNSIDDGESWEQPIKLTSLPTDFDYYLAQSVAPFFGDYWETKMIGDVTYCVWIDGRERVGAKAYFAKVNHLNPTSVTEISSITDRISISELSPSVTSDYSELRLKTTESVRLKIDLLDMNGLNLSKIFDSTVGVGVHRIPVKIPNTLPSNTYLIRIQTVYGTSTKKLIYIK